VKASHQRRQHALTTFFLMAKWTTKNSTFSVLAGRSSSSSSYISLIIHSFEERDDSDLNPNIEVEFQK
jgi:hypothetical protein